MDHTIHDRTAGRVEAAHDAAADPAGRGDGPWLSPEELRNKLAATDPVKEPDRYAYLHKLVSALPNPATAPATRPVEVTPTAAGFRIRFCTWCKQIDIRGPRRDTDVISILIIGKIILAAWNGKVMIVQDGICEACAEALKNGRSTTP